MWGGALQWDSEVPCMSMTTAATARTEPDSPPAMGLCQETKLLCSSGQLLADRKSVLTNSLVRAHQQPMNLRRSITAGNKTTHARLYGMGTDLAWPVSVRQGCCSATPQHEPQHPAAPPACSKSLLLRGS